MKIINWINLEVNMEYLSIEKIKLKIGENNLEQVCIGIRED